MSLDSSSPQAADIRSDRRREIRRHRSFYLFLFPAVMVVLIFNYIPIIGVVMAFQDFNVVKGYWASSFVGFAHFREFLTDGSFYRSLRNTLAMNGLFLLVGFPLPVVLALLLNEVRRRPFKRIVQSISYLPHFVSWVVVAGLVYKVLDPDTGLVSSIYRLVGLEPIAVLREARYFWGVMVFFGVWKEIGWNSIIFLAALTAIDPLLYEAAIVDGATRWQQTWRITIPLILPVVGLMLIFTIAKTFGGAGGGAGVAGISFDAVYNMANPLVMDTGLTVEYHIYLEGIRRARFSYAAAVGLALSTISLAVLLVANRISRRISGWQAF